MGAAELTLTNLTHPAILAFVLGLVAIALRSDLRIPDGGVKLISCYLLLAIGLKGGAALTQADPLDLVAPVAVTLLVGAITPLVAYRVLRWGRLSVVDAAGVAAHYGSVSAVTFAAAVTFATAAGSEPESFLPALVAVLEVPGILVALAVARRAGGNGSLREAVREVLSGSSMVLLLGGVAIGAAAGPAGRELVEPVFVTPFAGVLVLFLLHLGIVAGQRLRALRHTGAFLAAFAVAMPLAAGAVGVLAGTAAGMSVGGAAVFGAMAASASYIAAPAAVSVSLPEADLGKALTAAVGITFPLNLALGIPLFHVIATQVG